MGFAAGFSAGSNAVSSGINNTQSLFNQKRRNDREDKLFKRQDDAYQAGQDTYGAVNSLFSKKKDAQESFDMNKKLYEDQKAQVETEAQYDQLMQYKNALSKSESTLKQADQAFKLFKTADPMSMQNMILDQIQQTTGKKASPEAWQIANGMALKLFDMRQGIEQATNDATLFKKKMQETQANIAFKEAQTKYTDARTNSGSFDDGMNEYQRENIQLRRDQEVHRKEQEFKKASGKANEELAVTVDGWEDLTPRIKQMMVEDLATHGAPTLKLEKVDNKGLFSGDTLKLVDKNGKTVMSYNNDTKAYDDELRTTPKEQSDERFNKNFNASKKNVGEHSIYTPPQITPQLKRQQEDLSALLDQINKAN